MAGSPGPGQAALAMGAGRARSWRPDLRLPPSEWTIRQRSRARPRCAGLPGPGGRHSALRRVWTWAGQRWWRSRAAAGGLAPRRRRRAGGQAAGARLCRWGSGSAACRGRGWAGPALNSFEPASRQRPRPLRFCPPSRRNSVCPLRPEEELHLAL
ncbi:uncharacterized protein PS065_014827 [Dugong dugon]